MPAPPALRPAGEIEIAAAAPFSLALTAAALRRLPANRVDVITAEGSWARALSTRGARGAAALLVSQTAPDRLRVRAFGALGPEALAAVARRVLSAELDLSGFYRRAARAPGFGALARAMRGLKPPRYPTLWEALANAVVFQQVSLASASATMARVVERFGRAARAGGVTLRTFPRAEDLASAGASEVRALGLSAARAHALVSVARAVCEGAADEGALAALSSDEASRRLRALPGIGPWSAALVLLRGMGRLDVFPEGDSGAARGLREAFGAAVGDEARTARAVLAALGPYRGMLYFHLLMGRLARAGLVRLPAVVAARSYRPRARGSAQ